MTKKLLLLILGSLLALCLRASAAAHTVEDANTSLRSGDYDLALRISKENLPTAKSKDEQISYLVIMADVYKYKRQNALSIPYLTKALKLIDQSDQNRLAALHHKRGDAYADAGNLELALADYNAVTKNKMGPRQMVNLLKDRSNVYVRMNQNDKAIADLTMSLKLTETMLGGDTSHVSDLMRARGDKVAALYQRSKIYEKIGKTDEAKRDRLAADKLSEDI